MLGCAVENFKSLNLSESVAKAINEMGFEKPSEIQKESIPLLLTTEKDFIGQAQTGTGKTAAFAIPLLERMDFSKRSVQALVLAPTRELANQVEEQIKTIGKYTPLRSACVYGGTGYEKQIRALRNEKPHIVVGTPGRVIDMIDKGLLKLADANFCVLDEADEMLNMGFFEEVEKILKQFKENRQLVMFSATMPRTILDLIKKSFNEYDMVKVKKSSLSNDDIQQKYFVVRDKFFKEALARLIESEPEEVYGLVFCRTRVETREVGDELKKRGLSVEVLSGEMNQNDREYVMRRFKDKKVSIMVCTDVAARGIDVDNLTHVFNYGLPQDNESYVHRIGRTGRAGMKGKAYTIVGPKTSFAMRRIEKHINRKIEFAKLPTVDSLKLSAIEKELVGMQSLLSTITEKGSEYKVDKSFDSFRKQLAGLGEDELLKLMFSWKFNKTLRQYDRLSDIESAPGQSESRGGSSYGGRSRRSGARSGGGRPDRSRRRSSEGGGSGSSRSGERSRRNSGGSASRSRRARPTTR